MINDTSSGRAGEMNDAAPEVEDLRTVVHLRPGVVVVDGEHRVAVAEGQTPQAAAIAWIAGQRAAVAGRPIPVNAHENGTVTHFVVHPNGSISDVQPAPSATQMPPHATNHQPPPPAHRAPPAHQAARPTNPWMHQHADDENEPPPAPRRAASFLEDEQQTTESEEAPPAKWWQRFLGITPPGPSPEELAEQRDIRTVSQPWLGPRTVAVVNGKGGSNKTPTTALLAAIFARSAGGGVLAWDNNETRGSLGWRTEKSPHHDATVQDLIPATQELMDARAALSKISAFVHHQPDDMYDVLRSNPELLAAEQRLTTQQFRAVHEVTQRYFRLTIMDSGNDESSYNYLNMLDAADQLVVSTTTAPDRTENARLLLSALWGRGDDHSRNLARNAVVIVSQADREEENAEVIAARFRELVGSAESVVTVPYDPALRRMQLRHQNLAADTQRAYLRAAAEVAHRLNTERSGS